MRKLLFSVFVLLIFLCAKCEDDTPKNPIDLLPPATQTGENTFGCLVDGEAFTPDGRPLSFRGRYEYNGGFYLTVSGKRYMNEDIISIGCSTRELAVKSNTTYNLLEPISNNAAGRYFAKSQENYTSSQYKGELFISKHDSINYIISGTFWFDVKDHLGEVHQIREGRFDIKY